MNVVIAATIQRGARVASKNVKDQLPRLISHFPELKNIYTATINLRLDEPLHVSRLERTTFVQWWDVDEGREGFWHPERFSILPIMFEYPIDNPSKDAWLYVSHHSNYFAKAQTVSGRFRFEEVEIVTGKINGLVYGQRCKIHIEKTEDIDVG
jgi:hypothetical protein